MGRIKELRSKIKDGTATEEEKVELQELETEVSEVDPSEASGEEEAEEEGDEEKDLQSLGKKLAQIAVGEMRRQMSNDVKKGALLDGGSEKKEQPKPKGKELMKQFFVALLENDHTKLDHLSTVNADGGFLIPQEYADTFVEDRRNLTVMRRAGATQVSITTNIFNVPQLASRPRVSWTNELAAKSSTSASWTNITLTPYTLAAYMTASNQVIADAKIGGNIVETMTRLLTQAIAEAEDTAFFAGSGSGRPTGLNGYTVTTVSAGGVLNFTVLNNAKYRLKQGYRRNAAFFMNSRTLQAVSGLLDTQNRPIFMEALNEDFPRLLGKPVYEVDDLETTSIFYGDPSCYWIADREGISVRVSDEASVGGASAFEGNFTIIRVEERVDGELADTSGFVEITSVPIS